MCKHTQKTQYRAAVLVFVTLLLLAACTKNPAPTPTSQLQPTVTTASGTALAASANVTHQLVLPNVQTNSGLSSPAVTTTLTPTAVQQQAPAATPTATLTAQPSATAGPSATPYPTPSPIPLPTLTPRPPGVEITSPAIFTPIRARTPIYFAVNAMSPNGLQKVELYINGQVVASQDAKGVQEYNLVFGWQTDVNGDYQVQAKAVDTNGQILQSAQAVQSVRGGVDAVVNGTPVVSNIGSTVDIPDGTFTMGNNNGPVEEQPEHNVHISAFQMDRFEVTVGQYRDFVNATQRHTGAEAAHEPITRTWHIDDSPDRWEHPVRFVSWWDADAYCRWKGGRLPTEAEWEYAARGTDGRLYPWGNDFDPKRVPSGDTSAVGFYNGVSPFGVYDMAGNVWEWTDDWFDPLYYRSSAADNPHVPKNSDQKVIRGGGFNSTQDDLRVTRRIHNFPTTYHPDVGFRCVYLK